MTQLTGPVHVVINPAAGTDRPILNTLNSVFRQHDVTWEAAITHQAGDATRLARQAVEAGAGLVAVYGGDGTVMEAVNGLVEGDVPLAILPGGTGNAVAIELGIPLDLRQAAALIAQGEHRLRPVDVGRAGERSFLLRASIGLQATVAEQTSRKMKNNLGVLAYVLTALNALADPPRVTYHLTVDGETIEAQGVTCLVTNSGTLGRMNVRLSAKIAPDDGQLDVLVINNDLDSALSMAASIIEWEEMVAALQHWQGREITVQADPPQDVRIDGEPAGQTPLTATVQPGAVQVIVPG